MKPGLSLKVSQHLALTPQLQQSIRLLQLSTLELTQEVEQMLDSNPFLELEGDTAEREAFGVAQADTPVSTGDRLSEWAGSSETGDGTDSGVGSDEVAVVTDADGLSWEGDGSSDTWSDDAEWGGDAPARGAQHDDQTPQEAAQWTAQAESLQDHLHRQALRLRLGPPERAALHALIESLNADGYLEDSLAALVCAFDPQADEEQAQQCLHAFTVALGLLQSLEPTGVGARNLAECLQLQLQALRSSDRDVPPAVWDAAVLLCRQPLENLARRDAKRLAAQCGLDEALTRDAMACIARLEPKPGRPFADVQHQLVVPDVLVRPVARSAVAGGTPQWSVRINPEVMPRLRVHDVYANALRNHRASGDGASHAALQQRLQEARWFIKNIQQRFDTILRVSSAIVERQKNFFVHGELAMRPLVLREIADALGLHESTVSRVTTAKYMSTPVGTFELKYFFGSGLDTEAGGNASSTAVRALIKQFIAAEDPKRPLSDQQLADMLQAQGIACARRTVAKYREGLKIAPATLRKQR